jgi:hypothetical protein
MLIIPASLSKQFLLLPLSRSRVLEGTESGEDLVSEAVRVVGGDTAAPVVRVKWQQGSTDTSTDSASVCG